MTTGGWIIMIGSVTCVTTLFVWCIVRIITLPEPDSRLHGIDDIETPDVDRPDDPR
jgi:hypothetical protein